MALSPRLEIRQTQSLTITPQLQQAIKLLAMPNLQLAEFVAAEVEKNPLLELASPSRTQASTSRGPPGSGRGAEDWTDTLAAEPTMPQVLHAQIRASRADPAAVAAALVLACELDDDGYLRSSPAEAMLRQGLAPEAAVPGLALLQSCEPAGVGARDLRECLALQLSERDRLDPAMRTLVDNLELLARGQTAELRTLCRVGVEDFDEMLAELRALDPRPGQRFATAPVQLAVPDLHVLRQASGEWTVELNSETLPRVLVNNVYAASVGGLDAPNRHYIAECTAQANWLVRSLAQRARTVLRVTAEIVRHQQRFFALGPAELRPLTQRTVADQLGLHESTVSRVSTAKYLACDRGLFPLRFFFGASIRSLAGGEAFSAAAVQDRLRQLILAEPGARVLSDDRLVTMLQADGIDIARRTVAKYREGMGIPSSVARRRAEGERTLTTGGRGRD